MQASAQSTQTFGESLLAVSKPSSDTSTTYEGSTKSGRRQKSVSEDAKPAPTVAHSPAVLPPAPSPQALHQQILVAQQLPLINPALIPMQLPLGAPVVSPPASTVAAGPPTGDSIMVRSSGIESNLTRPAVVQSDSVLPSQTQDSDLPQAASILPWPTLQSTNASVAPVSQTATNRPNTVANANPKAVSSTVPDSLPKAASDAIPNPVTISVPQTVSTAVANTVQSSPSPVIPNAISNTPLNVAPIPAVHAAMNASAKGNVAPASPPVSTGQANPQAAAPDPSGFATGLSIPAATPGQLTALIQPGSGKLITGQAGASSSSAAAKPSAITGGNSKDGPGNAINDATGLRSASDQAAPQTGSQDTSASGDQSQGSTSSQGQSAAPAQMSFANHTVAATDHTQNAGIASPVADCSTARRHPWS